MTPNAIVVCGIVVYGAVRVERAAKMLDCSDRTIRRLIKRGILRAVRPGLRTWAVLKDDIELVLAQQAAPW